MRRLILGWIAALISIPLPAEGAPKFTPIDNFTLNRYLGTWYEIARMPVFFEKGLSKVTATYALKPDNSVKVTNRGVKENGKNSEANGKVKFADSTNKGYLKVSFFGPFYADYIIVDLDADYRYALIAGGSTKYLWILSRTPRLDSAVANRLVDKAQKLGFDTSQLIWTKQ
jgi:apolipoprotein D and lipocalin family protein